MVTQLFTVLDRSEPCAETVVGYIGVESCRESGLPKPPRAAQHTENAIILHMGFRYTDYGLYFGVRWVLEFYLDRVAGSWFGVQGLRLWRLKLYRGFRTLLYLSQESCEHLPRTHQVSLSGEQNGQCC